MTHPSQQTDKMLNDIVVSSDSISMSVSTGVRLSQGSICSLAVSCQLQLRTVPIRIVNNGNEHRVFYPTAQTRNKPSVQTVHSSHKRIHISRLQNEAPSALSGGHTFIKVRWPCLEREMRDYRKKKFKGCRTDVHGVHWAEIVLITCKTRNYATNFVKLSVYCT